MVVAFASGWVARGSGRPPAPTADGEARTREARDALHAVIDAWIDGRDADQALRRFERASASLTQLGERGPGAPADGVVAALAEADDVFGELRAGRPLSAASSRRLDRVEERVELAVGSEPL